MEKQIRIQKIAKKFCGLNCARCDKLECSAKDRTGFILDEVLPEVFERIRQLLIETDTVLESDSHSWQPEVGYDKKQLDKGLVDLAKEYGVDLYDTRKSFTSR